MITFLFDVPAVKLFRVDVGRKSKFGHTFGGPPLHQGVNFPGFKKPAHLFFHFNLLDPKIGIQIPGAQWLPIYFPLRNDEGEFSYRILSNSTIDILSRPYRRKNLKHYRFDQDFPPPFVQAPVHLEELVYNPRDPEDVYLFGGIFGVNMLSDTEQRAMRKKIAKKYRKIMGEDLVNEYEEEFPIDSLADAIEYIGGPFPQGFPDSTCPNRECENRSVRRSMHTFLYLSPEESDIPLYEEIGGGDCGQLTFEICPKCHAIRICNPCT
jgi:hypothetical protein